MPQGAIPGTPGVFDARNPTLIANFDTSYALGANQSETGYKSPAQILIDNPRVSATGTITITGTITNLDTIVYTFTCGTLTGGSRVVTVSIVTADTLSTVAEKTARAINDDTVLQAAGVFADVTAAGVCTVSWPGPVGNFCTITKNVTGAATEVVTLGNAGVLAGGSGPIIPTNNFEWSAGSQVVALWVNKPILLDYPNLTAMVTQGMPII